MAATNKVVVNISEASPGNPAAGESVELSQEEANAIEAEWTAWVESAAERAAKARDIARSTAISLLADSTANYKLLRAALLVATKRANTIAQKYNDLLTWLGSQTTLSNRNALNGFALSANVTVAQAKTAVENEINGGDSD